MKLFKVIFTGLANAGKTSILTVLDKQFQKLANMVPTKGVERSISAVLGCRVTKHDLGGQEQYRTEYLTTKQEALLEADAVFFVIDIQDENTYNQALEYYKKILEIIRQAGEHPFIIICLHKVDPVVYNQYKANITDIMSKFEEITGKWDHRFFITSIYNRRSIVEAFSYGIATFLPKKKSLDLILKNFLADARAKHVKGVMLWDQNSIFLSMIFNDKKTEKIGLTASMGILETIESFEKDGEFSSLLMDVNKEHQFLAIKVGKLYTTFVGKQIVIEKVWGLYEKHYLTEIEELIEKSD